MTTIKTKELIGQLRQAVEFVDPARDRKIYDLLADLSQYVEQSNKRQSLLIAKRILDHATGKYASVVEAADQLLRHLDSQR